MPKTHRFRAQPLSSAKLSSASQGECDYCSLDVNFAVVQSWFSAAIGLAWQQACAKALWFASEGTGFCLEKSPSSAGLAFFTGTKVQALCFLQLVCKSCPRSDQHGETKPQGSTEHSSCPAWWADRGENLEEGLGPWGQAGRPHPPASRAGARWARKKSDG